MVKETINKSTGHMIYTTTGFTEIHSNQEPHKAVKTRHSFVPCDRICREVILGGAVREKGLPEHWWAGKLTRVCTEIGRFWAPLTSC